MIDNPKNVKKIDIPSSLKHLRDTTERILNFFGALNLDGTDLFEIRLCFEESFINAIKYGNKGNEDLPVKLEMAYNDNEIYVAVEDEGDGFDPDKVPDPTQGNNLEATKGRGVFIVRNIMDKVKYNDKGNRVEMIKFYKKSN